MRIVWTVEVVSKLLLVSGAGYFLRSGLLQDPFSKKVKYSEYHVVPFEVRIPACGRTCPPDEESPAANARTWPPFSLLGRLGPGLALMPPLSSAVTFKH